MKVQKQLRGNGERILVIDDEHDVREMIAEILVQGGYRVESAADGEQGMGLLLKEEWDLIITDVAMPKRDGLALIAGVRGIQRSIPVIAISGNIEKEQLLPVARAFGADAALQKPFTIRALLETVAVALRRQQCGNHETD